MGEHPRLVGLDAEGEQAVVGDRQADQHGDDAGRAVRRARPRPARRSRAGRTSRGRPTSWTSRSTPTTEGEPGLHLDHRVEAELHRLRAARVAPVVHPEQYGDGRPEHERQQRDPSRCGARGDRRWCATLRSWPCSASSGTARTPPVDSTIRRPGDTDATSRLIRTIAAGRLLDLGPHHAPQAEGQRQEQPDGAGDGELRPVLAGEAAVEQPVLVERRSPPRAGPSRTTPGWSASTIDSVGTHEPVDEVGRRSRRPSCGSARRA